MKKAIFFAAAIIFAIDRIHAMEQIVLLTSDNQEFKLDVSEIPLFGTIENTVVDQFPKKIDGSIDYGAKEEPIPLLRISHDLLGKIVNGVDPDSLTIETLAALLHGADYLNARALDERYAKRLAVLLLSDEFMYQLRENPKIHPIADILSAAKYFVQKHIPQEWAESVAIEHGGHVSSVAFSLDGELLATGSDDKKTRIIDVATGVIAHAIEHGDCVRSVAFSPNSKLLATGSDDNKARIIDVAKAVERHTIEHGDWVKSVAFSPNSELLVTGSDDNKAQIIDVATGVVRHTIEHGDWVLSVALSPNSELLAMGSNDKKARIIHMATGVVRHTINHGDCVRSVAFSPNSDLLATGSEDKKARIIDVATGVVRHTIEHGHWVKSVVFSPSGELLASGCGDEKARIIDVATGVVRHKIEHGNWVLSVAFSPSGELLATGCGDRKARIFANLKSTPEDALLIHYLKWCRNKGYQCKKNEWVRQMVENHRNKSVLEKLFPELCNQNRYHTDEDVEFCAMMQRIRRDEKY